MDNISYIAQFQIQGILSERYQVFQEQKQKLTVKSQKYIFNFPCLLQSEFPQWRKYYFPGHFQDTIAIVQDKLYKI